MDWYVEQAGEVAGPLSTGDAAEWLRGLGRAEALVWRDGLDGWEAAGRQPEFAALFPKRPPPLPSRDQGSAPAAMPALPIMGEPAPAENPKDETFELAPAPRARPPGSPWSRYFARQIDLIYLGFLTIFAFVYALSIWTPQLYRDFSSSNAGLQGLVAVLFAVVANSAIISIFGNSLGKKVFGLVAIQSAPTASAGPLWVVRREFRVWLYGLAAGVPIIALFTMTRNHAEVKAGRPARYDRNTCEVLEHPIGKVRRTIGMLLAVVLIFGAFGIGKLQEMDDERVARAKPWVNPVTLLTAQIPGGWSIDAVNSNPAEKLFAFSSGDGMEAVFIGAEEFADTLRDRLDIERYGLALEGNLANSVVFKGRWVQTTFRGKTVLTRDATMLGQNWPAVYAIWQSGNTFWRVMSLSAIPSSPPRLSELAIVTELVSSVPN